MFGNSLTKKNWKIITFFFFPFKKKPKKTKQQENIVSQPRTTNHGIKIFSKTRNETDSKQGLRTQIVL